MDYKIYEFPIPDSTTNFVAILKKFIKKSDDIYVSQINRELPLTATSKAEMWPEKHIFFSEIDYEQDLETMAEEEAIYFGPFEKILDFISKREYYIDDEILMTIQMATDEYDRLHAELNKTPFSMINAIDHATHIFVKVAALNFDGARLLEKLLKHLLTLYPQIESYLLDEISPTYNRSTVPNAMTHKASLVSKSVPQKPEGIDLDEWLMFRLEMMPFGLKKLTFKEIAKITGYSYDAVKQRDRRLGKELRKKYGLEDFHLSL